MGASVSENGTLVYAQTERSASAAVDMVRSRGPRPRNAGRRGFVPQPRAFTRRTRVAVALATGTPDNVDIWIIDIARNIRSRLTIDPGSDTSPVWSPDGTHIAFQASRPGKDISLASGIDQRNGRR